MDVPIVVADQGFANLARQMGRWMEQVLGSEYHRFHGERTWAPAIDLYEDESCFYMVADLAGVDPETVDLHVEENTNRLILRGERQAPRPPAGEKRCSNPRPGTLRLHVMEINRGPFLRSLDLPEMVDRPGICACYRQGLLWVRMPKKG